MSLLLVVAILLALSLVFTLFVRVKDIPVPEAVSPTLHLDERKAAIYENLRDLQFEYRVGKLSDADYQQTKLSLQKELAAVLAETERVKAEAIAPRAASSVKQEAARQDISATQDAVKPSESTACPHCGATFAESMKFCGKCGKEMAA